VTASATPEPPQLTWTEIDGVPVVWSDLPEPVVACLLFRVGWADEPLAWRGLTHLVEHLTLTRPDSGPAYERNGFTGAVTTRFVMTGTLEQAAGYLGSVCGSLTDLPQDRLDHEVQVLRAEEHAWRPGVVELLLTRRFGAVGLGTAAYPQFGLNGLEPHAVTAWRDRWFTAGNALLWMSRRPPASLRLRLRPGPRQPTPEASPLELPLPAIVANPGTGCAIGMVGPRDPETVLGARVLDHHLLRTLRHELGLSYAAGASYERLDTATAHVVLTADGVPGREAETSDAMVAALRQVADDGPSPEDLERAREAMRAPLAQPDRRAPGLAELDSAASSHLMGREVRAQADVVKEYDRITPDQVAVAVGRLAGTAIMVAPPGVSPRALQLNPYPAWSASVVAGASVPRRLTVQGGAPPGTRLVAGDEGLSLVDGAGHAVTVRFTQCEAVLRWPDGRRRVIGEDGLSIMFVPEEWEFPERLSRSIEERVPAQLFVPVSDPAPEAVSKPVWGPAPGDDLSCQVCGRSPALFLPLRKVTGMILPYTIRTTRQVLCRECGIAVFRHVSASTMVTGWWSPVAYFVNLVVLGLNGNHRLRLAELAPPQGEPVAPPLAIGPSLLARPATVVLALAVGLPLALLAWNVLSSMAGR
jgi:hypothetical protein